MSKLDRERLDQTTVRQYLPNDAKPTLRSRMRQGGMRLREAAAWAGRNNRPQPVQVNVNQPQATEQARPTAARTFPTDGGMTPNQRLETIANDIAGERAQPQPQHTPWHQTEQGRAIQEKYAKAEERAEDVKNRWDARREQREFKMWSERRDRQQAQEKARQEWVKEQHQAWQREQKQKAQPASPATGETVAKDQQQPGQTSQEKGETRTDTPEAKDTPAKDQRQSDQPSREQARQEWIKEQHQAWQREQKQKAQPASPATGETAAKDQEQPGQTSQEKGQTRTDTPAKQETTAERYEKADQATSGQRSDTNPITRRPLRPQGIRPETAGRAEHPDQERAAAQALDRRQAEFLIKVASASLSALAHARTLGSGLFWASTRCL